VGGGEAGEDRGPERAEYLRVIVSELNRISSHLIAFGSFTADMGAFTPFLYAIRERERVNDLFETICGNRLTYNYARIGGVSGDAPPGFLEKTGEFLDYFEPKLDEYNNLISYNKIFRPPAGQRRRDLRGGGDRLRADGPQPARLGRPLRPAEGRAVLGVPEVRLQGMRGHRGAREARDCFDRYMVRINEMRESIKIVRQAIAQIPEGPVLAKVPRVFKPPVGEVYFRTENPRGETGFYLISDGSVNAYRLKIRAGSFVTMNIFEKVTRGLMIADVVAVIGSFDIILPEIDR